MINLQEQYKKKQISAISGDLLNSPSPLMLADLSTTEITCWAQKVGNYDTLEFQRATQSNYSDASTVQNTSSAIFADTGRTIDTTYYYRVRAVASGYNSSEWATGSQKTLGILPLHLWGDGLERGTTNAYGIVDTSNNVTELRSHIGAANTMTPDGTAGKIIYQTSHAADLNERVSNIYFPPSGVHSLASNIVLNGDFTIIWVANNNTTAFLRTLLYNSSIVDKIEIRWTSATITNAATTRSITVTGAVPHLYTVIFIVKRVGTTLYYSRNGVDFASGAGNANSYTFDKAFTNGDNAHFWMERFWIAESDMTLAQINEVINYLRQDDYTFASIDASPVIQNGSFSALGGDYIVNANFAASITGGPSWNPFLIKGDVGFIKLPLADGAPYYQADQIYNYKFSTNEINGPIDLGNPTESTDTHNTGSIGLIDNTLYHAEYSQHYDDTVPTTIIVKRFGKDWDMGAFTEIPRGNGIPPFTASLGQYPQFAQSTNYKWIFYQEWDGNTAAWITGLRTKDNFNSYEKLRICTTEDAASEWFYHAVVHREDGTLSLVLNQVTAGSRYKYAAYIQSSDDGETWTDLSGGFSQSIYNGVSPLTLTELVTNCDILDGTALGNSVKATSINYDPTDGEIYGVVTAGDDTNLKFFYGTSGGSWTLKTIDLLSKNIVVGTFTDGGVANGTNTPSVMRTGANAYRFWLQEDITVWRVSEFTSADKGDSFSYVGAIHGNLTDTHYRIILARNIHYTGASPYTGNKGLIATRELGGGNSSCLISEL
jgi:hypothetical protein